MLKVFKSCNHQTPKVLNSLQKANKQDGKDAIKSCNHHTPKVLNSLQKAIKKDSKRLEVHLRYIWGHLATAYGHLATRTFPPPGGEGGVRTFKLPKGMNQGPLISGSQKQSLPPCPYIYIFDYGIVSWAFNCKKHLGNPPRYGALKGGWSYKDDPKDTQRSQGEAETNQPAKSRWSFFFAQLFVLFFVLFWLLILFFDWISLECKTGLNGTSWSTQSTRPGGGICDQVASCDQQQNVDCHENHIQLTVNIQSTRALFL